MGSACLLCGRGRWVGVVDGGGIERNRTPQKDMTLYASICLRHTLLHYQVAFINHPLKVYSNGAREYQ